MNKEKITITRKGMAKFSQIFTIILVFLVYVIADFVSATGSVDFIKDPFYWLLVGINLVLVITIMITVRSMRKQSRLDNSTKINNDLLFVDRARKLIIGNAYSKSLSEHLEEINKENKYQAYIRKTNKKLNFWNNFKLISNSKKDKIMRKFEEKLEIPKEEVLKRFIVYKKITRTGLFSGVDGKIVSVDDFDISAHNGKDIAQMVGLKALLVFLFSAITGTIAVQFVFQGVQALFGTFLKVLSLAIACSSAISQADNFVDYNISEAMIKRIDILSNFINTIPDLKQKMIEAKKNENE